MGSPPVNTIIGLPNRRTSSRRRQPSSVLSSSGLRAGIALARQCTQAKSQAWLTSQITSSGASLKSMSHGKVQSGCQRGRDCKYRNWLGPQQLAMARKRARLGYIAQLNSTSGASAAITLSLGATASSSAPPTGHGLTRKDEAAYASIEPANRRTRSAIQATNRSLEQG